MPDEFKGIRNWMPRMELEGCVRASYVLQVDPDIHGIKAYCRVWCPKKSMSHRDSMQVLSFCSTFFIYNESLEALMLQGNY